MSNSNHFIIQTALFLILVSFSFSFAHFHNESSPMHEATPPPHKESPPQSPQATPPPHIECPPPPHSPQATPPPHKESPPQSPQATPPPHKESPPQATPPSHKESPPQSPQATPPPHKESPPQSPQATPPPHQESPPHSSPTTPPTQDNSSSQYSSHTSYKYKGCWSRVIAFGDSNTDTGNGFLIGGLKSYASSSKGQYGGHRLSNGKLIVDHLTDSLALPTVTPFKSSSVSPDYPGSVNFAIAGSSTLSRDYFYNNVIGHTFMWSRVPESYQTQIDWFNDYILERTRRHGPNVCRTEMANALFWIGGIGGNDYIRMYGSSITSRMLSDLSVAHTSKFLSTLLSRGAQYIVVQGLPPLGCLPSQLSLSPLTDRDNDGCSKNTNSKIRIHNKLLQNRLVHFRRQYPSAMIVYADAYAAYKAILSKYKQYQFQEPFRACCGSSEDGAFNFDVHCLCGSSGSSVCRDPTKYLSWDGIHFTETMNRQLTELFLYKGYCQPSFEELLKKKKCV